MVDNSPSNDPGSDDEREMLSVSGPETGNERTQDSDGALSAGEIIDDFEIIEEVGRGGMGVVYRAFERSLRRIVALKVLHPDVATNPSVSKRFRREAILAANLSHQNIVPVFQIDEKEPPRYFTMEFVQGRSVKQKVESVGFLPLAGAVRIGLQTAEAMQFAHERSIIHKDIKPSNLLLQDHLERVRITDFGIARDVTGQLSLFQGETCVAQDPVQRLSLSPLSRQKYGELKVHSSS